MLSLACRRPAACAVRGSGLEIDALWYLRQVLSVERASDTATGALYNPLIPDKQETCRYSLHSLQAWWQRQNVDSYFAFSSGREPSAGSLSNSGDPKGSVRWFSRLRRGQRTGKKTGALVDIEEAHEPRDHVDTQYESPTEEIWPPQKHQRKFAAKVLRGLDAVMSGGLDTNLERLLQQGFTVEEVRMSPDNMVAYILWSCLPQKEEHAQHTLHKSAGRIRAALASAMNVRRVPRLEFRLDKLSSEQQQVLDALERLKEDR